MSPTAAIVIGSLFFGVGSATGSVPLAADNFWLAMPAGTSAKIERKENDDQ